MGQMKRLFIVNHITLCILLFILVITNTSNASSDIKFIEHIVKHGETISNIAENYYGTHKTIVFYEPDKQKYMVSVIIQKFNKIDPKSLKIGEKIKLPAIEGLPFKKDDLNMKGEKYVAYRKMAEKITDIQYHIDTGTKLFKEKKFKEAIVEFNTVIDITPDNEAVLEYLSKSYFQQGKAFLNEKKYIMADEAFQTTLKYNPECQECVEFIKETKELKEISIAFDNYNKYANHLLQLKKLENKWNEAFCNFKKSYSELKVSDEKYKEILAHLNVLCETNFLNLIKSIEYQINTIDKLTEKTSSLKKEIKEKGIKIETELAKNMVGIILDSKTDLKEHVEKIKISTQYKEYKDIIEFDCDIVQLIDAINKIAELQKYPIEKKLIFIDDEAKSILLTLADIRLKQFKKNLGNIIIKDGEKNEQN